LFQQSRKLFITTFSDGCLGSRNDEERSEMRYVMRIADLVNHQNFERTLRFLWEHSCLSVCSPYSPDLAVLLVAFGLFLRFFLFI